MAPAHTKHTFTTNGPQRPKTNKQGYSMTLDIKDATSIPLLERLQQAIDGKLQVTVFTVNGGRLKGEIICVLTDEAKAVNGFVLTNPQGNWVSDVLLVNTVSIERVG